MRPQEAQPVSQGGAEVKLVAENESTCIPIGAKHGLESPGKIPLRLIEMQPSGYLGEDDIRPV
jgi:mannose-1-phosphate guanylyltransferase/mannose-6-phosphate isomerase